MKYHILSALCSLLLALPAQSAVVYSGMQNLAIPLNFDGLYLNPYTGATSGSQPGAWNTEPWINPFFGGVYIGNDALLRSVITGIDQIVNLTSGTMIDASSNFVAGESGSTTHVGAGANQFQIGAPGFIGFAFEPNPSGSTLFGWLQITIENTGAGTIHDWAYENTQGAGIQAGFTGLVPEPSRAVLLLGALAGVMMRRRRQQ